MEDIVVPIALFLLIGSSIWTILFYRFRSRQELQLTLRNAVDAGQTISPEAIEDLVAAMRPKKSDLRRGLIWMALALGVMVFSLTIDDADARSITGASAFPLFIGLAYLLLWKLGGDR